MMVVENIRDVAILKPVQLLQGDPRIGPMHISLYIALVLLAQGKQHLDPVQVSARKLMPLAKIGGKTPYHRTMLELAEYGYIRYEPSFNPNKASLVYMVDDGSTPEQNDEKYH